MLNYMHMSLGRLRTLPAALLLALGTLFLAPDPASFAASAYSITVGDMLSVYVYRQEDLNMSVRVDDSGCIRYPIAGKIHVVGKSPAEIESIIARALRREGFADPEVVVSVSSFAPRKIFVLGEVNADTDFGSTIPEGGTLTAMQAIGLAGGLKPSADFNKIVVRRTDPSGKIVMLPVPARAILNGEAANDVLLVPSDTVIVPKAKPVSVMGTVNKPGEFYAAPDAPLTVSRAITLAGGVERPKSLSKIRVTRGDKSFKVDIQSLLEDGEGGGDMVLEPGDVVYVPETRW